MIFTLSMLVLMTVAGKVTHFIQIRSRTQIVQARPHKKCSFLAPFLYGVPMTITQLS